MTLLEVRDLVVEYGPEVRAVDKVSFDVGRGEIFGVLGESGSGKTTLMTAITRLQRPPARITGGTVTYRPAEGKPVELVGCTPRELRELRWERVSVVFQSAMSSLNPVMRVGTQFADAIRAHRSVKRAEAWHRAAELLELVGIPRDRVRSYPHELSGGMRQRAAIALSLACRPDLVVMDEPTTAVDVVMQRQILDNLKDLQASFGFSVLFVTHDLSLLVELADRIMVMYAGRAVEIASAKDIYRDPQHPYTQGLRDSFPSLHGPRRELRGIGGAPPDLRRLPAGCAFEPRCPHRVDDCKGTLPLLIERDRTQAACLLLDRQEVGHAGGH
ncbi:ABC transporter ATP-binding protein [Kribbella sp.]|uniref:ABC transporter ATP-binding protein n=1 Tax=Kribbella sp. TaxID=1871183 RepID=UPI002D32AEA8|nr:ABC transporter ATP-binding protein [Kribbella sp.]HZX08085.1 ABC transporter ATP-binding protein [Kribbella sp.]